MITFKVNGTPKAQPRTRRSRSGGVYTPPSADGWKDLVYYAARQEAPVEPLEGPVRLTLEFVMPRPKSHYGTGRNAGKQKPNVPYYHASKPDRDNLEKATVDVLTELGFWKDDCQVADGPITKRYVLDAERPGVEVTVEPM